MKAFAPIFALLVSCSVHAQDLRQFELTYRFLLNGQIIGQVTDTFRQEAAQYQLKSVAQPDRDLAFLLPTLTLSSEGSIRDQHFYPLHFNQLRSNAPGKVVAADFDWTRKILTHTYKGRTQTLPLTDGTQDALSQVYSFTLLDKLPDTLDLPVSNGRKLMTYHYEKQPATRIDSPLGSFDAVEYRRIARADENAISVWIAPELHNLPLRIRVRENSGVFEQQLARANVQ